MNKEDELKKETIWSKLGKISLCLMISFWNASINIASGIATVVILSGGLFYLKVNNVTNVIYIQVLFSKVILFLINQWKLFWICFFIVFFIQKYRDLK